MTTTTQNIIKITLAVLALVGLWGIILANGTTTKSDDVQNVVKELVELKDRKQECLDSLSYQEAIEEYKGISHCWLDDERIVELKKQLQEFLRNDYEKVDEKIEEKKIELLASENTPAVEKLNFLLSE